MDPLQRIADETEEDYQTLEKILKQAGVQTYRSFLDIDKVGSLNNIYRPPVTPRDHFAVIGETIYAQSGIEGCQDVLDQISPKNINVVASNGVLCTANICRVGKDLWWDIHHVEQDTVDTYTQILTDQGFRVHTSNRGYHSDGSFCVIKPGCVVSLWDIQDYEKEFPGWEVLYLPDQSWSKVHPFLEMKWKVGGRWWLKGEENNQDLIKFINAWLSDWVGYVEETVFDVNMLSIDQNTVICNNYNKQVFDLFKRHKVEPVVFNFRHRYFWDGGVHCITQDLYREGKQEDYFA